MSINRWGVYLVLGLFLQGMGIGLWAVVQVNWAKWQANYVPQMLEPLQILPSDVVEWVEEKECKINGVLHDVYRKVETPQGLFLYAVRDENETFWLEILLNLPTSPATSYLQICWIWGMADLPVSQQAFYFFNKLFDHIGDHTVQLNPQLFSSLSSPPPEWVLNSLSVE